MLLLAGTQALPTDLVFTISNQRSTIQRMTPEEFRQIALSLPDTEESSHMNHPDFRVRGKIFATLGPDGTWGMAKLTPTQQQDYLRLEPAFKPASGKWGDGGATIITLAEGEESAIRAALTAAWRNIIEKP